MDKSHTEIYKDISDVYEKKRDFPKAIEAYKNYLDEMKSSPDISDLFLIWSFELLCCYRFGLSG